MAWNIEDFLKAAIGKRRRLNANEADAVDSNGVTESSFGGNRVPALNTDQMTPQQANSSVQMNFRRANDANNAGGLSGIVRGILDKIGSSSGRQGSDSIENLLSGGTEPTLGSGYRGALIPNASADTQTVRNSEPSSDRSNVPPLIRDSSTLTRPEITMPAPPSARDVLYDRIRDLETKDYNGKDRDSDHNWKDVLRSIALGVAQSAAQVRPGSDLGTTLGMVLGGAGAGAIGGGVDRNFDNRMVDQAKLAQLYPQYQRATEVERQRQADADRIEDREALREDRKWRREYQQGLLNDRLEDNKRQGANTASLITKREIDAAKKNIKVVQDAKTGQWSAIMTDPRTGQTTAVNTTMDGKPFTSESAAKMMAEAALDRMVSGQNFQREEKAKDRAADKEKFLQNFRLQQQKMQQSMAGDAQKLMQWKTEQIQKINKSLQEGVMSNDLAQEMMGIVNALK